MDVANTPTHDLCLALADEMRTRGAAFAIIVVGDGKPSIYGPTKVSREADGLVRGLFSAIREVAAGDNVNETRIPERE